MFKSLVVVSAFAFASVAHAADITGHVGIASNFIEEGVAIGGDNFNPSVNAGVRFGGPRGLFADAVVDVIDMNSGFDDMLYRSEFSAGIARTVAGTKFGYGLRVARVNYSGGDDTAPENETNVIANISYTNAFATVKQVVASNFGDDRYMTVGYTMPVNDKLAVTGAASWKRYDVAGVTRYNDTRLTAAYAVTKAVTATATVSVGGEDAAKVDLDDRFVVGASFAF